jgi:hypothetical protein
MKVAEMPEIRAADRGIVQSDLQCILCGYNLRTLRQDGKCPECGSDVARSLEPALSIHPDDREWLIQIRDGVTLLIVAFLWQIPVLLADIYDPFTRPRPAYLAASVAIVPWVLSAFAAWKLSYRRKSSHDNDAGAVRIPLRLSAIIVLLGVSLLSDFDSGRHDFAVSIMLATFPCTLLVYVRLVQLASRLGWVYVSALQSAGVAILLLINLSTACIVVFRSDFFRIQGSDMIAALTVFPQPGIPTWATLVVSFQSVNQRGSFAEIIALIVPVIWLIFFATIWFRLTSFLRSSVTAEGASPLDSETQIARKNYAAS